MKWYFTALASVLFLISCVDENELQIPDTSGTSEELTENTCLAGEVNVKFSDEMLSIIEGDLTDGNLVTRSVGLNQSLESLGITSFRRLYPHGGEFEPRRREAGLHRWYRVTYASTVSLTKATSDLSQIDGIDLVEPVRKIEIKSTPYFNDAMYRDLWGLHNSEYPGIDINVEPVWDNYTVGNPEVIVAVIDQGVDVNHPDLKDNCLASGHANYADKGGISPGYHGTHVAGTIAAVSNNGVGVAGIAGGNKAAGKAGVKILSHQIFGATGAMGDSGPAIADAADKGALISQNSWGYVYDRDGDGVISSDELATAKASQISSSDKDGVDYFIKYAGCDNYGRQLPTSLMKGGVVIFAAGNDALPNAAPANYDRVIAVGAIEPDGRRASFSNYGNWVDIAAPGVDIMSTFYPEQYAMSQGTSMACPHVSGVAALLLSYYGCQGFTADMLKEKLLGGMNTDKVRESDKIGGLLDAYGAFNYGDTSVPEPVNDLEVLGRGDNIDLTWTQTLDSGGKPVYAAMIVYSKDRAAVEVATSSSYEGCDVYTHVIDVPVGEKTSCTVRNLEFSAQYFCKVFSYTYGMKFSEPSELAEVYTTENHDPEIIVNLPEDCNEISVKSHEAMSIPVDIIDYDEHEFNVEYTPGSAADKLSKRSTGYSIELTPSAAPEGSYEAVLSVTDVHGAITVTKIPYTILPNHAPEKIKEIEGIFLKSKSEFLIDMSEYVKDIDGEQLKFEVEIASPQVLHLNARANLIYLTPLKYGQSAVTISAVDARGEKVTFEFNVMIKDPNQALSVYPNPVKDFVNVGTMDEAETAICIYSSTGKLMYDNTSKVSALEPARIDMREYAPGTYTMTVKFGGKEYKETVVKL